MIYLKTKREIELIKEACRITKGMLDIVEKNIRPGISTLELDQIAEDYCRSQGAIPNFKGYGDFPGSICASIDDVVVHGIPRADIILKEGQIISIDCGAYIRGFNGDAARTFPVGKISEEKQKLIIRNNNLNIFNLFHLVHYLLLSFIYIMITLIHFF